MQMPLSREVASQMVNKDGRLTDAEKEAVCDYLGRDYKEGCLKDNDSIDGVIAGLYWRTFSRFS